MSLKTKLAVALSGIFMLASTSFADDTTTNNNSGSGLFVEPMVTYESGTLKLDYPVAGSSNEDVKGLGVGARLGMHFHDVLFAALDARYSRPRYTSSALGESADANAYNAGVTLGLQTPIVGLRLWGTYIADGMLDPDTIRGVDVKYQGFNGYRIGGGLYVAMVSVNLEYQEAKYNKNSVSAASGFAAGSLDNLYGTQKSYLVSVSFPFAL